MGNLAAMRALLLSSIVLVAAVALAAEPVANATKQAGDLPHEPSATRPLPDPVVRKKEWQEHPGTHHREYALPIENTKPDNNTRPNPDPMLSTDIVDKLGLKTLYATMVAETDCLVCHELSEVLEQEIGFDGAECSNYQKIMK